MRNTTGWALTFALVFTGCANTTPPDSSRSGSPPPSSYRPPDSPGSSPPPTTYADAGPSYGYDAGSYAAPDAGTTGGPPADTAQAEAFLQADLRAFTAECRCHFSEFGFGSAAECMTVASGVMISPTDVSCVAAAFGARGDLLSCYTAALNEYATCAQTATCGATTCDEIGSDCGEDAGVDTALAACFPDPGGA
jgi:hypothetical protein